MVQIQLIKMLEDILANHLALHDAGLGEVRANEHALVIALEQSLSLGVVGGNRAVEENDRQVLSGNSVHQILSRSDCTGLDQVDDDGIRTGNQSGVDVVGLRLLIGVGVLINNLQTLCFHRGIQSGTHAGKIDIAERVPRHIGFTFSRSDAAEHGQTERAREHLGNKLFHGKHLFFLFQRDSSR